MAKPDFPTHPEGNGSERQKKKNQQIGPQHFPVDFLGDLKQVMMIEPNSFLRE